MIDQIKTVIARAEGTLLQDAIGAVSLMTIFMAALYLPGFA
ncbi:MAG: hypothetical protein WBC85_08200 [Planktotalea sp.]